MSWCFKTFDLQCIGSESISCFVAIRYISAISVILRWVSGTVRFYTIKWDKCIYFFKNCANCTFVTLIFEKGFWHFSHLVDDVIQSVLQGIHLQIVRWDNHISQLNHILLVTYTYLKDITIADCREMLVFLAPTVRWYLTIHNDTHI